MKKSLLLSCACAVALSASAQYVSMPLSLPPSKASVPARAQEGMWFTYAGNPATSVGINAVSSIGGAMLIPASQYSGFKVTAVKVAVNSGAQTTVFIANSLTGTPLTTQSFTPGSSVWNEVTLDNPVTIGTDDLYAGYYLNAVAGEYPIVMDNMKPGVAAGDNVGFVNGNDATNTTLGWSHIGSDFGNVCIQAKIEGEFPEVDPTVNSLSAPSVVGLNKPFNASISITNFGVNPISEVTVSLAVDDNAPEVRTVTLAEPIEFAVTGACPIIGLVFAEEGSHTIAATVTAVNGNAVELPTVSATVATSICQTPRMMVVEEGTSTGCGYCPYGIIAMEYMKETYPQGYIGIGAHCSGLGNDPMIIPYFSSNGAAPGGSLPMCQVNRLTGGPDYPDKATLEEYYLENFNGEVGLADIYMDAEWTDGTMTAVNLKTRSMFGIDKTSAKYRISYVMLENNVGPYKQSNYLSGAGEVAGVWSDLSSSANWFFNDVARYVSSYSGDTGSLPTTIVAGEYYENAKTVALTGLKNYFNTAIDVRPENTEMIAMIVCTSPKEIINAVKIEAADIKFPENVQSQTIEWDGSLQFKDRYYVGETIELAATASSGEPVQYQLQCASNVATISGNVVTFKAEGEAYVYAVQPGSADLKRVSLVQKVICKKDEQTITWDQDLSAIQVDVPVVLEAVSSSGLPITYKMTTNSTAAAKLSNGVVTFSKPGKCKITASQKGDNQYRAATNVVRELECVASGIENVTIDQLGDARFFNLQGIEIVKPESGVVYIVVKNGEARKVLVK